MELAESDSKNELDWDAIRLGQRTNKNLTEKEKDKDLNLTFVLPETENVAGSEEQQRTAMSSGCFSKSCSK